MRIPTHGIGPTVALVFFASISASSPATAQHIDPERPSATQQRGSLGQPFPGFVKDLEVIGPNRFVVTISDRPDGSGSDLVQILTPQAGPVGQIFVPAQRKVYDVEPAPNGGVWALHYSADEAAEAQTGAGGMRLQLLDRDGRPVGASSLLTQSLFTDADTFDQPRRGWVIPFPGGAVAVAFTAFDPSTRRHQLRLTTFRPDGREGATDVLEAGLDHMPSVSVRATEDGGALLAWGSGDPMGERLRLTRLEPDGQWADLARPVWEPFGGRGRTFDVRLVPIDGGGEVAAVFTLGGDQVARRFDRDGFPKGGIEVLNATGTLIEPLRIDEGRLIGLTEGVAGQAGLYMVGTADTDLVEVDVLHARITALVQESQDSVVVAAVVPAPSGAGGDAPTFSYLYRIRR